METGDEKRDIARSSWQIAVFCEERFRKNRALHVHLRKAAVKLVFTELYGSLQNRKVEL